MYGIVRIMILIISFPNCVNFPKELLCITLYFTVKYATGDHPIGYWLLVSETNNVDVKFTSHKNSRRGPGFSLDVRSIPCVARCHDPVQEVRVAAGETLRGALVTHTNSDGLYPNRACQEWKLITDENQVRCFPSSKTTMQNIQSKPM